MKKTHKAWKWIVPVLVVAAIAVVVVLRLSGSSASAFNEETARTADIVTYYTFSGNLEPGEAKIVTATTRGTVKELLADEGDTVEDEQEVLAPKSGARYKAPMAGTISDIYVKADDTFSPGDKLFRVADYAAPILKVKVDEYDVSALSRGMGCTVTVQATGARLDGTITRIAQEATVESDVAYYEVEISVPQNGSLVMGLTCEVSVPRQSSLNATTVAMDAIQYDDNNRPFVYCYSRGNEIVSQSVTLGINNGTIVEIVDGVKSGETILVPKTSSFATMMSMRYGR